MLSVSTLKIDVVKNSIFAFHKSASYVYSKSAESFSDKKSLNSFFTLASTAEPAQLWKSELLVYIVSIFSIVYIVSINHTCANPHRCHWGHKLAHRTFIIGDDAGEESNPAWFSYLKLSLHSWQHIFICLRSTFTIKIIETIDMEALKAILPFSE